MFPGEYNSKTVGGLALLGHELVHVGQWRKGIFGGLNPFSLIFSYKRIDDKAEAQEQMIFRDLTRSNFSGC
jgi:hypothetical protein